MKKFILLTLIAFFANSCNLKPQNLDNNMDKYKVRAPEFKDGLDWLNTDKPLTIKDLKGKIVILDFWTYCCINCMHILPELKRLEEKYNKELVVIGVHSAKFNTEKGTENIRQAILRYNITHPVVNDYNFDIWRTYSAHAWPTLFLIDPNGYIVGTHSGEGIYDLFDYNIQVLIDKYKDQINYEPINFALEKDKKQKSLLSFPGKISADSKNNRLIITDSGNNRILITDLDGNILTTIGSGKQGFKNGNFEDAEFNSPQGTVIKNNILYIADTENHAIRKADLDKKTVETIAGLGYQVYSRKPSGNAKDVGLNSPWDLTIVNNFLYIAMAGPHQIWKIDLTNNIISLHAGNGFENIVDGNLYNAQLAQPSGLTTDGNVLYFADSEVSAIRKADLEPNGKVTTLIGTGLFDFGDKDGSFSYALLQHPIGIVYNTGKLYVADTYNNKIKEVDLSNKKITTLAGTGKEGFTNGSLSSASFNEPAGLTVLNNKIYVADTNNDLIRVIDLNTKQVSTLIIKPKENLGKIDVSNIKFENTLRTGFVENTIINLKIALPKGNVINPNIESYLTLFNESGEVIKSFIVNKIDDTFNINLTSINQPVYLNILLYYCDKSENGLCYIIDENYKIIDNKKDTPITIEINN